MDPALMAIAGQQPDADRVPARHQSITIMLDLVHPAWPSWRLLTSDGRQGSITAGRPFRHDAIMAHRITVQRV
jgi:hypothetical protein